MDIFDSLHFDSYDDKLIELVKKHEFLYNPNTPGFKNFNRKETTWEQIASILGKDPKDVKTRWTRLRERFTREKKRLESLSSDTTSDEQYNEVWFLYNSLLFLEPFIRTRIGKRFSLSDVDAHNRREANPECQEVGLGTKAYDSESDQRLIQLVKPHKVLYTREKIPQKTQLKVVAWRRIAKQINMDARSCLYRWNILRTQFLREYRRKEAMRNDAASASEPREMRVWSLYDAMDFLEDHIPPKRFKSGGDFYVMPDNENVISKSEEDSYNSMDDTILEIDDAKNENLIEIEVAKGENIIEIEDIKDMSDEENCVYLDSSQYESELLDEISSVENQVVEHENNARVVESLMAPRTITIQKRPAPSKPVDREVEAFLTIVRTKLTGMQMTNKNKAMEDILQYCNAIQSYERLNSKRLPTVILACPNCDLHQHGKTCGTGNNKSNNVMRHC